MREWEYGGMSLGRPFAVGASNSWNHMHATCMAANVMYGSCNCQESIVKIGLEHIS